MSEHVRRGTGSRRLLLIAAMLLAAVSVFAVATAGNAQAKKKSKKAKVTLSVTTTNQAALLKAGKLNVKVKSTAKTTVKVSAIQGGKSNRFKPRTVKFKKKGTKKISLALTSGGKTALKTCGAKTVLVKGSYKKGKKKAKASKKKVLAKDSTRCITPPPPVEPARGTCDPLDTKVCMQPWPSNFYTVPDANTTTGLRLDIPTAAMPKNTDGTPIDPTDINRNDGFSPGNLIVTKIPEVETPAAFNNSGIVSATTMSTYTDPNQAVVVMDATTGQRQPIYAELDANPTTKSVDQLTPGQPPVPILGGHPNDDPTNTGDVNLIIRAAKNYLPGHRYVVVIRNLKDASNNAVQPAAAFKACRDGSEITDPNLLYRCNEIKDKVFPVLDANGISKDNLYLSWDFTVASDRSTTGRMTDIRDNAFARLGDTNLADRKIAGTSPTVDPLAYCDVSDQIPPANPGDPVTWPAKCGSNYPGIGSYNPANPASSPIPNASKVQRTVVGYIRNVPCYLNINGCPSGASFEFNADGSVKTNTTFTVDVPFRCIIPRSTTAGGTVHPGKTGIYGHGLLGSLNQIGSTEDVANSVNATWCAANFDGFADNDIGTVAASLKDLSNFHKLTDRMQQGFLNFLMLGRAMATPAPGGFATKAAFTVDHDGVNPITAGSAIDTSAGADTRGLYYGISQGGIMGGALTAVDPDVDRGVLGVPAINYSTLLPRSVDFDEYANGIINDLYLPGVGLYDNYTNKAELPVIFSVMQLMWDRGEGDGYVHAMNPANANLPNTNPHTVLLELATGDHQVANIAAEVEARTLGAKLYTPSLVAGRSWAGQSFGIDTFAPPLAAGNSNAIMYFDGGPTGYTGPRGQGSKVAPIENVPPRPEWGYGGDPHGYPRQSPDGIGSAASFWGNGSIPTCASGNYCYSNSWDGVTGLP